MKPYKPLSPREVKIYNVAAYAIIFAISVGITWLILTVLDWTIF